MPFSASPTDEATGHRNCGGSTASLAVSRLKKTAAFSLILDGDQRRGMHGLVASGCDDQGDRLAGIVNFVVLQGKVALAMRMKMAPWLRRRVHARHVAMGEDRQHARRLLGGLVSIDTVRPLAMVLWTMAACAASASGMSAV